VDVGATAPSQAVGEDAVKEPGDRPVVQDGRRLGLV
jgi:hypothetical protein